MATTTRPNGVVLYRGPSQYDGSPTVCILTGLVNPTDNVKVGREMLQTWVLTEDVLPSEAAKSGRDVGVCGGCPLRPSAGGGCYVVLFNAPNGIWRAFHRGVYPEVSLEQALQLCAGKLVRLGAYGDPAAVPQEVWEWTLCRARGWTGYTHGWRHPKFQGLRRWCMASVETVAGAQAAAERGFSTYRVRPRGNNDLLPGEHQCPASDEAGHQKTCAECGACSGRRDGQRFISIQAHGARFRRAEAVIARGR